MKKYRVRMRGLAIVDGVYEVKAKSEQAAIDAAAEHTGDVLWDYEGLDKVTDSYAEEVK
jgi:hypothetical protein